MNIEIELAKLTRRVRQLERKHSTLAALVTLLPGARRSVQSIGPLSAGSIDVPVAWSPPFLNDNYILLPELVTGGAALGQVHATLKLGTRANAGCEVTVSAAQAVAVAILDVLAVRV